MNDTKVFQALLGATDPWMVEAVEMDTTRETVTIELGLKEGTICNTALGSALKNQDCKRGHWGQQSRNGSNCLESNEWGNLRSRNCAGIH